MDYYRVYGLYGTKWQKGVDVVESSTEHPAKFSKRLIYWIIQTGLEKQWWDHRTIILDPFGGIGLGGVACARYGIPWLGVELEERFVEIGRRNLLLAGGKDQVLIQGDSRNFVEIVREAGGCITSPPFSQPETRDRHQVQSGNVAEFMTRATTVDRQGSHEGNIAKLPIGALTSPPYGNRVDDKGVDQPGYEGFVDKLGEYGVSEGQVGNLREGSTYWEAVTDIYTQVREILSPGAYFVLVVKAFVKNKRLVDLPNMTGQVLTDIGFTPVAYIDAMLVSEDGSKEYKSFFRRVAESKGSPRIDSEVVLVFRK